MISCVEYLDSHHGRLRDPKLSKKARLIASDHYYVNFIYALILKQKRKQYIKPFKTLKIAIHAL